MGKKIIFTDVTQAGVFSQPEPASHLVPDWYKKNQSYIGNKKSVDKNMTTSTIKKCMPVFDAMTAGYIITLNGDVLVSQKEIDGNIVQWFDWTDSSQVLFHSILQALEHPAMNGNDFPKWNNIWSIKTPPGYSCMFLNPMHRDLPFTILPGIVDTDTYTPPVLFPFVMNDKKWSGLIPAGTPIAQVVPFKRDSWHSKLGNEKNFKEQNKTLTLLNSQFFNKYKQMFWSKKEYK